MRPKIICEMLTFVDGRLPFSRFALDVGDRDAGANAAMEKGLSSGQAGRIKVMDGSVPGPCSPAASYVVGRTLTGDGGVTVL